MVVSLLVGSALIEAPCDGLIYTVKGSAEPMPWIPIKTGVEELRPPFAFNTNSIRRGVVCTSPATRVSSVVTSSLHLLTSFPS